MSLSGNMQTMELAELLQWIAMGRKTGTLAFIRNKTKNFIFFREGRIISSRSNEPTKQLGHFLLFQGKISESQLKRALEVQQQSHAILGKVLVQEGFLTRDEVEKALISRTQEVIYDLFLWDDGYFHFTAGGFDPEELILIDIDMNAIIFEGVRRKDEWGRIRQAFRSNDVILELRPGSDLKNAALTPLQKKMLFLVTQGKSISQIILEVHGSDFLVNWELFQLYEKDVLDVHEPVALPAPVEDPALFFSRGLDLMQKGKYNEAIAAFQATLRLDPQNAWADEQIEKAERAICEEYYRNSIRGDMIPYFLVPEASLTRYTLTSEEGFVASRINGLWDVNSIVMLAPLREIEILQILDKLMKMDIIRLK